MSSGPRAGKTKPPGRLGLRGECRKGLDYRFLLGDNEPTGEDEAPLLKAWHGRDAVYGSKPDRVETEPYEPKTDELVLPRTPDDYLHVPYKVRNAHRWAYERGYEYVFQCTADTYVHLRRLAAQAQVLSCGAYAFVGKMALPWYASGGAGYWVSKRAMRAYVYGEVDDCFERPLGRRHASQGRNRADTRRALR